MAKKGTPRNRPAQNTSKPREPKSSPRLYRGGPYPEWPDTRITTARPDPELAARYPRER